MSNRCQALAELAGGADALRSRPLARIVSHGERNRSRASRHPLKVGEQVADCEKVVGGTLLGRVEVLLSPPGDTLLQAVTSAVGAATIPTGFDVLVVEAIPTREMDQRLPAPDIPDLLSVTEAADVLKVSRQRVLQLINGGRVPSVQGGIDVRDPSSVSGCTGAARRAGETI